jgi:hypothetical protein
MPAFIQKELKKEQCLKVNISLIEVCKEEFLGFSGFLPSFWEYPTLKTSGSPKIQKRGN